jgi:hypothetical protein
MPRDSVRPPGPPFKLAESVTLTFDVFGLGR